MTQVERGELADHNLHLSNIADILKNRVLEQTRFEVLEEDEVGVMNQQF